MKRFFLLLVATITISIGVGVGNASASTPAGWGEWLMPTGTICVETQGVAVVAQAAGYWNRNSDAVMVAKSNCTGYSRAMTVKLVGYSAADGACAKTYTASGTGWNWQNVRGVWTWTPQAPTIFINYWKAYAGGCRTTTGQKLHVYSHELGHVLGLAHNCWVSVMASCKTYSWKYTTPTYVDYGLINRRY